jgi:hypothetical protein
VIQLNIIESLVILACLPAGPVSGLARKPTQVRSGSKLINPRHTGVAIPLPNSFHPAVDIASADLSFQRSLNSFSPNLTLRKYLKSRFFPAILGNFFNFPMDRNYSRQFPTLMNFIVNPEKIRL